MSSQTETVPCMIITLDDYKFNLEDPNEPNGFCEYKGKMEVSYDGEFLGIDTWECPVDADFSETPIQQVTLVGANQANLLIGAILVLLESYGEPSLYNDEDIQKEYKQMAEEAKNTYAEKTVEQLSE